MNEKECYFSLRSITKQLEACIRDVIRYDAHICRLGQERAITARLAIYLNREFGELWDVDSEFRKVGSGKLDKTYPAVMTRRNKQNIMNVSQSLSRMDSIRRQERYVMPTGNYLADATARPDIIVHRRGLFDVEENLLMVEAKVGEPDISKDKLKLMSFTAGAEQNNGLILRYQLGLLIAFPMLNAKLNRLKAMVVGDLYVSGEYRHSHTWMVDVDNLALQKREKIEAAAVKRGECSLEEIF